MKDYKPKIIAVLLFLIGIQKMDAQQATVAAGGNVIGSGGTVSYSVGQGVYKTQTGTTGTVNQGVQQPIEIVTLSGEEYANIRLEAIVFPNPTTSNLTLKISDSNLENLDYQFFDIQGKLLVNGTISSEETVFDMEKYPTATYILKVNANSKGLKTFKIIKN